MLDHPLGAPLTLQVETKYYSAALNMFLCDTVDGAEKVQAHEGCIVILPAEVRGKYKPHWLIIALYNDKILFRAPWTCTCRQ